MSKFKAGHGVNIRKSRGTSPKRVLGSGIGEVNDDNRNRAIYGVRIFRHWTRHRGIKMDKTLADEPKSKTIRREMQTQ